MRDFIPTPDFYRHVAAVHRTEAEARRGHQPDFAAILDTWAANADRRALDAEMDHQPDLFGAAA